MLDKLNDVQTLALTIYGEARGEPVEGQIAVGCVIRNRVAARKESYKQICLEPKQFSCWNSEDSNYPILIGKSDKMNSELEPILKQCLYVADGIVNDFILDNTDGAMNYMTTDLYKSNMIHWARDMRPSVIYGKQTFLV